MIIYASHNSLSYLPPKNLWGKITKPWGKCQSLDLVEQYYNNISYFDIRVKIINKSWHIVHNNIDYGELDIPDLSNKLNKICKINTDKNIYIRLGLDVRRKPKDEIDYVNKFIALTKLIDNITLSNCIIDDCITFWNWKHINYLTSDDNYNRATVYEYHTSVCSNKFNYIKGTKWFAKKFNSYYRNIFQSKKEDKTSNVIMLDYIQY